MEHYFQISEDKQSELASMLLLITPTYLIHSGVRKRRVIPFMTVVLFATNWSSGTRD